MGVDLRSSWGRERGVLPASYALGAECARGGARGRSGSGTAWWSGAARRTYAFPAPGSEGRIPGRASRAILFPVVSGASNVCVRALGVIEGRRFRRNSPDSSAFDDAGGSGGRHLRRNPPQTSAFDGRGDADADIFIAPARGANRPGGGSGRGRGAGRGGRERTRPLSAERERLRSPLVRLGGVGGSGTGPDPTAREPEAWPARRAREQTFSPV